MTERRRSPGGVLARLGAWAADYAWATDRQLRHLVRRSRLPAGPGSGSSTGLGRAPVVLLPGIYEAWEFLEPVADALARAGHPVHAVPRLKHNARPVPEAADVVVELLQQADLTGVVLVAHSKGGLIGKHVLLSAAGDRVLGMVAIATPFAGSRWARYMLSRALRSFDPRDPVLLALAGDWPDEPPTAGGRRGRSPRRRWRGWSWWCWPWCSRPSSAGRGPAGRGSVRHSPCAAVGSAGGRDAAAGSRAGRRPEPRPARPA